MRRTGYLPEPGHRRTPFRALASRLGASLTSMVSLEIHAPMVLDQGQTGSCVGHSVSCAAATAMAFKGDPLPFVPSPADLYRLGRALDRVPDDLGRLPPLVDHGSAPNEVFRAAAEWGVRQMVPLLDRYSDADPTTINDEPTLDDLESDGVSMLVGEYEIFSTGRQRAVDVATALSNGIPVTLAIAGGSDAFQSYDGGVVGPLNAPLDHYVCCLGAEQMGDGSYVFTVRNSWGTGWGEGGNFRLSEAGLDQCGSLVAAQFRRAP